MKGSGDLMFSPLCHTVEQNGKKINVLIYKDDDCLWWLEVIDELRHSFVCEDLFETDALAFAYSKQMIMTISNLNNN